MNENPVQQNKIDASNFEADIGEMYNDARRKESAAFAMQYVDQSRVKQEQRNEGAAEKLDGAFKGFSDAAGDNQVARAGLGVGRDIALGTIQAPRSAVRGVAKGINSMISFVDELDDWVPMPSLFEIDPETKKSKFKPGFRSENDMEAALGQEIGAPQLPVPDAPKVPTVTGGAIEAIAQFATGLKGVDKIGKAAGVAAKSDEAAAVAGRGVKFLKSIGKGSAAEVLAFDQHDQRLSNVIQQVPALQNPVTDFLQADTADGFAEGKLKQAIEGLAMNAAGDALFNGIRLLKKGKGAADEMKAEGSTIDDLFTLPDEEKAGVGISGKNFEYLGNSEGERLFRRFDKVEAAQDEVQGAFGKTKQLGGKPAEAIADYEINFARIEGPDDIKQLMDEMVNRPELKISIEAERRGTRDARTTLTAATDIDGFDSLMARRTGDAFNAETIVAARKIYYDTTTKLMDAAKRAAGAEASDIDQFNFRKMVAIHHAVQKEFMGVRAESGRALHAWSIPIGGTDADNVRALEQVLNEHGGADASKQLARRLSDLGNNLNTSQINAITQKAAGARTLDAVAEAWTMGLLTNPVTHVVNLSSNVLTGLVLGMERFAAASVKGSPVTYGEGVQFYTGMLESQKTALSNMAQAFRTGQTGFGLGKIDLPRTRATARDILDPEGKAGYASKAVDWWGGMLTKYVGGSLAAGDEYSKTILYNAQIRSLAFREGNVMGLSGDALQKHIADALANPSASMRADAVTFANYGTFTRELGKTGQAVQRIIARHPALRFVAPFIRTPANIFKFTFERTPLAVLSSNIRNDLNAGGVRRATAMARIGTGTSVMAIGVDLAMNGKITGSGPSDGDARAALRRTGWQPYSVKIGDTWYSYSRFEPVATLLGMSADMADILSNYEAYDMESQSEADELVTAAAIAMGNQVVGKTFLSGFANLAEVLSDPKRNGDAFLNRFAGSFVPAGSAALERAINPEQEQVFNMIDSIRSRLPGGSAFVPKRRNIWGEEIQYFYPSENIAMNAAQRITSLVNPIYYSQEKDAPVDAWMLKNGFEIDMPNKSQSFDGVRVDLREYPKAYERLVELRGNGVQLMKYGNQTMKEFFRNLAEEKDPYGRHIGFFMALGKDFDDQQNFINAVVSDYTAAARDQVLQEFEELPDAIASQRQKSMRMNSVRQSIKRQGENQ